MTHFAQRHHVSLSKRPFNGTLKDCAHNTSPGQKQTDEKIQNASCFTIKANFYHLYSMPFTGILKDCENNTESGRKQTDEKMHCNILIFSAN